VSAFELVSGRLTPEAIAQLEEPAVRPAPAQSEPSYVTRAREQRRRTVRHEAAHLIAAHLVGCDVKAVSIEPGILTRGGRDEAGSVVYSRGRSDAVGQLVVDLAGYVSAVMQSGDADDLAFDAAAHDRAQAMSAAQYLDPRRPDAILMRAQALARDLLHRHQAGVERLVEQLMTVKGLEGEQLVATVEAALDGSDPDEWQVRRRQAAEAAGPDPVAWGAAWEAAGPRWRGAALEDTAEVYATTWRAAEDRRVAEMLRQRAAIERTAAAEAPNDAAG
jgi:hypothetical protein